MSDYNVLKKEDFINEGFKEKLNSLKKSNNNLYQFVKESTKESYFSGIREDVFEYILEHASEFPDDFDLAYSIAQFINNRSMDVSWYEFLNEKNEEIVNKIPLVDFCYIMTEAVDKNISFSVFNSLYEKHMDDPLNMVEDIDNYSAEVSNDSFNESSDDNSPTKDDVASITYNDDNNEISEHVEGNVEIPAYNREPEYADMFNDILNIMSDKHDDERFSLQEKMQNSMSEFSVMLSTVFRLWDNDRKELDRLASLYKLQQRVLYTQQKKINEMRYDIENLQFRLNEAGKNEAKREEMKKKISEMQELMYSEVDKLEAGGVS